MECECGWNVTIGCFKLCKSFFMFFAAGLNDMCSSKPMHLIDESLPWRFKILCNSQRILFDRAGLNKSKWCDLNHPFFQVVFSSHQCKDGVLFLGFFIGDGIHELISQTCFFCLELHVCMYIYMYVFIETKYIFIQKDWMIFFPVVYTAVYSLRFFIRQQLCWWLLFRDHSWEEFVMWFVQLDFVLEVEVVSGDEKRFFPTL